MARRGGQEIVVILWRDIPAQVNCQVDRERHQLLLPSKFQRAIDRAKRKAGIYTAQEDVAQWRRVSRPAIGEPQAAAQAEVERLDAEYSAARLGRLAFVGGWEADVDGAAMSAADLGDLAALEELDEAAAGDETPDSPAPEIQEQSR